MILVDANLLLYAKNLRAPEHVVASRWLNDRLSSDSRVGLAWESLTAFLRISTHARIFPDPLTAATAWAQVEEWLDLPNVWTPVPTTKHRETLGHLLRSSGATAKLVPDAHLAALAIEHGLVLCSADRDFVRFEGLRFQNPLG